MAVVLTVNNQASILNISDQVKVVTLIHFFSPWLCNAGVKETTFYECYNLFVSLIWTLYECCSWQNNALYESDKQASLFETDEGTLYFGPWTCPGHNQETSTFTECQYTIFSPHLPGPRYLYTAWKVSQLLKPMLKCAVLLMDFKFLSMNCFLMRFVNCCWTCFSCDLRSLIPFSNSAILLSLLMMVSVE